MWSGYRFGLIEQANLFRKAQFLRCDNFKAITIEYRFQLGFVYHSSPRMAASNIQSPPRATSLLTDKIPSQPTTSNGMNRPRLTDIAGKMKHFQLQVSIVEHDYFLRVDAQQVEALRLPWFQCIRDYDLHVRPTQVG